MDTPSTAETAAPVSEAPAPPPESTPAPEAPQDDAKALDALKRKVSGATRNRQQVMEAKARADALEAQVKELAPLRELQELAKSNPAEAARKLLGSKLLDAYTGLTPDVLGLQQDEADVSALPKQVREQLAKVTALEEKLAKLEPVAGKVEAFEKQRAEVEEQIQAQHREAQTRAIYDAGFKLATPEALGVLAKHPEKDALIAAEWVILMGEASAAGTLQRPEEAASLVPEAAKRAEAKFRQQYGWLLTDPGDSGKDSGKSTGARRTGNSTEARSGSGQTARRDMRNRLATLRQEIGTVSPGETAEPAGTPTPSNKPKPRSVVPGSLGTAEPQQGKLSWRERARLLKREL